MRSDCPERAAWLSRKGRTAAVEEKGASGSGTSDPCLLTTAQAKQRTALPRMYVNMHKTGMESEDRNRLVAVIDTGSTHTLVSSAHVERADIIGSAEALPILCVSDFCERERERETDVTSLISR